VSLASQLWGRALQAVILVSGVWIVVADDEPDLVAVVLVMALLLTVIDFSIQWRIERRRERQNRA
jgi:hypothetical protein